MGEMAELIINGEVCEICSCNFNDDEIPGHPRTCYDCGGTGGQTL